MEELDGIVVNEEVAKSTPCKCYKIILPNGKEVILCWSEGIIGMLSKEQIKKYCTKLEIEEAPESIKRRLTKFYEAAKKTAGLPLKERIRVMSKLLRGER